MLLTVNTLIGYRHDHEKFTIKRILWIDSGYTKLILIDIFANTSIPHYVEVEEIEYGLQSNQMFLVDKDPYQTYKTDDEISQKERIVQNRGWEVIQAIADKDNEPSIFEVKKRAELIKNASMQFNISSKTVYKYLRRYWQRGKNKNALLPDYQNIGRVYENQTSGKKRGRPKRYKNIIGEGVNVNEDTKRIFRTALNKFYYSSVKNSLKTAYELMRKEFYVDDKTSLLRASEEVPTFGQFKYFFYKERNRKKEIYSREGSKQYLQNHRPLLGNSTSETIGPGFYEIDATVGDIYLVSRYNRKWIIGRPIVYMCIDRFSRMVVGLYVGLEGPSWNGAMNALANAMTNKVEYCRQYDIEISEDHWPVHHLCDTLMADRGELEGKLSESLISSLHIKVLNSSPYRADAKGIVERSFRVINEKVIKPFLPGTVNLNAVRGDKNYRLDGVLDIFQFTQIMIKSCLHHNNSWLNEYKRDETMIEDDIEPIPLKLWNWGMKNRAGLLRYVSEDIVKLNLMPRKTAVISGRGIKVNGLLYTSESALKERLFEKARINGSWKVDVSYDPRNINHIYIRKENGKSFEKCYLLDGQDTHKNKSVEELVYLQEYEKLQKLQKEDEQLQSKMDLVSDIEDIVKQAEKLTKEHQDELQDGKESKKRKLKGIREHRQLEKLLNRENEAFELGKDVTKEKGQVISIGIVNRQTSEEEVDEYENELALLKKKQKENSYGKSE